MEKKKRSAVEWAMHYRQIVILVVCCLVAFGIYSLPQMRKNEFPDFTIRQGVVVAVAPGNTAEEMVEQVTKPLENYIFSYKEVKKGKTFSKSRDGIVYIQVEFHQVLQEMDRFCAVSRNRSCGKTGKVLRTSIAPPHGIFRLTFKPL